MEGVIVYIIVLIGVLLLACIPAVIAEKKGKKALTWYFYGVFLWPIAFIHALILPDIHIQHALQQLANQTAKEKTVVSQGINTSSDVFPKVIDVDAPLVVLSYDISTDENMAFVNYECNPHSSS